MIAIRVRNWLGYGMLTGWVLLAPIAGPGWAQSEEPDPKAAQREEESLHRKNLLELNKAAISAKADRDVAVRNCQRDRDCIKQANADYQDRMREIQNSRTEENARHAKRMLEIRNAAREAGSGKGYLKGRVEENVGTEPEPPTGLLIDLANAIDQLAPHYDMTRPHEGLRVIADIVTGMGLGYLGKGLAATFKSTMGKITGKVAEAAADAATETVPPTPSWTPGSGRAPTSRGPAPRPIPDAAPTGGSHPPGAVLSSGPLPPGVTVPDILRNTPRPLYLQQTPSSCGLACLKMVVETIQRRSWPEAFYRQISRGTWGSAPGGYTPGVGTEMGNLAEAMQKAGLKATLRTGQSLDDLAAATQNGYPAVVHIGSPTSGHYVVADAVVGAPGNRYVLLRDPLNLAHTDANTRQLLINSGFDNMPVMPEQDFAAAFSGWSILLGP